MIVIIHGVTRLCTIRGARKSGKAFQRILEAYGIGQNQLLLAMGINATNVSRRINENRDPAGGAIVYIKNALEKIDPAAENFVLGYLCNSELSSESLKALRLNRFRFLEKVLSRNPNCLVSAFALVLLKISRRSFKAIIPSVGMGLLLGRFDMRSRKLRDYISRKWLGQNQIRATKLPRNYGFRFSSKLRRRLYRYLTLFLLFRVIFTGVRLGIDIVVAALRVLRLLPEIIAFIQRVLTTVTWL